MVTNEHVHNGDAHRNKSKSSCRLVVKNEMVWTFLSNFTIQN